MTAKLIATPEQFEKVAAYHRAKAVDAKVERQFKRDMVKKLMDEGIERSIAQDMVRFGLY